MLRAGATRKSWLLLLFFAEIDLRLFGTATTGSLDSSRYGACGEKSPIIGTSVVFLSPSSVDAGGLQCQEPGNSSADVADGRRWKRDQEFVPCDRRRPRIEETRWRTF